MPRDLPLEAETIIDALVEGMFNGDELVKRFNCILAEQLAILTFTYQNDWDKHLPLVHHSPTVSRTSSLLQKKIRTHTVLDFGYPQTPQWQDQSMPADSRTEETQHTFRTAAEFWHVKKGTTVCMNMDRTLQ
ncbi:hypothetical protein MHYP_G00090560 [Metynnis hypsauchen]